VHYKTFAQRRNSLTTHFSKRIPVVKRRMTAKPHTFPAAYPCYALFSNSFLSLSQSVWDLWWTKWYLDRSFSGCFALPLSLSFHQCSTLVFHSCIADGGSSCNWQRCLIKYLNPLVSFPCFKVLTCAHNVLIIVQYGLVLRLFVLRRFTFTTLVQSDRALPACDASLSQLMRLLST